MCFSLYWVVQLIVFLIIVVAMFQVANVLLPKLMAPNGPLGTPSGALIVAILRILVGAVILIWFVYLIYDLVSCMMALPHRPLMR